MTKNAIFCATGVFLGFVIGFFIANGVSRPSPTAAANPTQTTGTAGPLDPSQSGGELPPGHPEIGGAADGGSPSGSAAANSAEAQSAMDKADRSPKDFSSQTAAARVFYQLRDYTKAALYLERALELKPKDFDALVMMGNAKYDAGDYVTAEKYYERALELKQDNPDVRNDLGNTFFQREPPDYPRALSEYRKSIAIDPRHINTWKNIAAAALRLRDKTTATEAIEKLAEIDPSNTDLPPLREALSQIGP